MQHGRHTRLPQGQTAAVWHAAVASGRRPGTRWRTGGSQALTVDDKGVADEPSCLTRELVIHEGLQLEKAEVVLPQPFVVDTQQRRDVERAEKRVRDQVAVDGLAVARQRPHSPLSLEGMRQAEKL